MLRSMLACLDNLQAKCKLADLDASTAGDAGPEMSTLKSRNYGTQPIQKVSLAFTKTNIVLSFTKASHLCVPL
jgi:hypothetical protein